MANAVQAWITTESTGATGETLGGIRPGNGVDSFFAVFATMFIHVRGLPMFSTLLGFGLGLVVASLYRKHYPLPQARKVVARRYLILALFGLVHMFLVFYGDIMFIYGLIGLVLAALFTVSSASLRIIAYSLLLLFALGGSAVAVLMYFVGELELPGLRDSTTQITSVGDYFTSNLVAASSMFASAPFAVLSLGGLTIIGYVWAREGYLVDVDTHRTILLRWVIVAAAIIVLCGLPWGLSAIGVLDPALEQTFATLNESWGPFTGPGILAAFALATNNMQKRANSSTAAAPKWAFPLIALGKRSMSGYLAQSFLFIPLVSSFGLGLGMESSITGKLGVGLLVWLITVALAMVLEVTNTQGPFEWAHRHLSYGRTGAIEPRKPDA